MQSAVAVLTYRRCDTLRTMLSGLERHCPVYRTAVFEDCGQRDATAGVLQCGRVPEYSRDLMAYRYVRDEGPLGSTANYTNTEIYMGETNLGVAGNSNRAIRWFLEETNADHLCLCNDDLHVTGDFVRFYAQGHQDLGVGLFCFCDFDHHPSYRWTTYRVRGYGVKFLPRFTGIMLSITRELLQKVGYFDPVFTKFGQEHCDHTIRCRYAGGIRLEGQDMHCLDLEHNHLRHQECDSSVQGADRARANAEADAIMQRCTADYAWRHYYRPYQLVLPQKAGGYSGGGIPVQNLLDCGYRLVSDLAL